MENTLNSSILYLSLLLVLLSIAGFFVFRHVIKTRRTEKALSQLERKLTKEQGSAQEHFELGCIYLDKKLFTQAISQLQKALKAKDFETDAEKAAVHNALGFAYAAQEQYDIAIRQYKDALKLREDYVTAFNNLGFAYERKRLMNQALEVYEEALKYDPNNTTAKKRAESMRRQLGVSV